MRVSHILSAAACAAAVCTFAPATARSQVYLGLGGGASFPISDLSNSFNTGYNILADLGAHIPLTPLGVRIDGMFNQLPGKPDLDGGGSFNAQIWTANANLTASLIPGSPITPYLIAGMGYYNTSYHISASGTTVIASGSTHDNDFGLNGGAGIKAGLGGIGLFAEARYHNIFTSGTHIQMIPISAGVRFGG
jgi:opacity protein-like surface antigen